MAEWGLAVLGLIGVWAAAITLVVLIVLTMDFVTDMVRLIRGQPRLARRRGKRYGSEYA